jgi:hypothetical protein
MTLPTIVDTAIGEISALLREGAVILDKDETGVVRGKFRYDNGTGKFTYTRTFESLSEMAVWRTFMGKEWAYGAIVHTPE